MILDKQLVLSDAAAITTDAYSDVMDQVVAGRADPPLTLILRVVTAFDTAEEDGTLDITIETDDNESFTSATTVHTIAQLAEATLVAGYLIAHIALPHNLERYMRIKYNVGTHAFTAGAIDAYLVKESQQHSQAALV
jgi:hypothetical protein